MTNKKNHKTPLYASSLFTCISCLLLLLVSCSVVGNKQDSIMDDKQQVSHVLKEYYKGITNRDTKLFYLNSTNDFALYEQGKVMDNLTFSKLILSLDPKTKIEYEFTDIKINLSKNFAHLFYKTTGIITTNNNIEKRQYLESALLIKEKNEWKIFDQINLGMGAVIVTAKGINSDFVSRVFTPQATVFEDLVTGSAHCSLIPYWSEKLNKKEMLAHQLSERFGKLLCVNNGERVKISGSAITYSTEHIYL